MSQYTLTKTRHSTSLFSEHTDQRVSRRLELGNTISTSLLWTSRIDSQQNSIYIRTRLLTLPWSNVNPITTTTLPSGKNLRQPEMPLILHWVSPIYTWRTSKGRSSYSYLLVSRFSHHHGVVLCSTARSFSSGVIFLQMSLSKARVISVGVVRTSKRTSPSQLRSRS